MMQMNTNGKMPPHGNVGPPPAKTVVDRRARQRRVGHEHADDEQGDGADLQEARQVVARAQQHPHRQHAGDEAVAAAAQDRLILGQREIRLQRASRGSSCRRRPRPASRPRRSATPRRRALADACTCTGRRTAIGMVQAMVNVPQELPGTSAHPAGNVIRTGPSTPWKSSPSASLRDGTCRCVIRARPLLRNLDTELVGARLRVDRAGSERNIQQENQW